MIHVRVYDFFIKNNYERISSGKFFDNKMNLYSDEFIDEMICYFRKREEYEKCEILKKFRDRKHNHDKYYVNR